MRGTLFKVKDNKFSHMRIWATLARAAVEMRNALQQAEFLMFSPPFMPQRLWGGLIVGHQPLMSAS